MEVITSHDDAIKCNKNRYRQSYLYQNLLWLASFKGGYKIIDIKPFTIKLTKIKQRSDLFDYAKAKRGTYRRDYSIALVLQKKENKNSFIISRIDWWLDDGYKVFKNEVKNNIDFDEQTSYIDMAFTSKLLACHFKTSS